MKKIIVICAALLLTACATNGDIDNLQLQVNQTNSRLQVLEGKVAIQEANIATTQNVANQALQNSKDTDAKLNSLFQKAMIK